MNRHDMSCHASLALLLCSLLAACRCAAENVDLSTVPKRDTVQLTIYNSEDLTLVRETRVVTFKKGVNPLQFSWANTLIDPSSVELKFLTSGRQARRARHDLPARQAADAVLERPERVRRRSDDPDHLLHQRHHLERRLRRASPTRTKQTMDVEGFVRVTNNSGEEYEDAQVRLVVGTINLVEKIAQLAQIPMSEVSKLDARTARTSFATRSRLHGRDGRRRRRRRRQPAPRRSEKQIIKEGLSEYFIYTIEGTETIPNGWSKRMRSLRSRRRAAQDPVPLPPAGVRRAARADVPADQRRGVEARHDAAARRRRPRLPRQRPRRALVPRRSRRSSTSRSATRSS